MKKLDMKDLLVIVLLCGIRVDPRKNTVVSGFPDRDGLCTTDDCFYKIYRTDNNSDDDGCGFAKGAARIADACGDVRADDADNADSGDRVRSGLRRRLAAAYDVGASEICFGTCGSTGNLLAICRGDRLSEGAAPCRKKGAYVHERRSDDYQKSASCIFGVLSEAVPVL